MSFAETLKKLREDNSFSMSEAAQLIGVSTSTYYNWEVNGNYPRTDAIRKIADAYGVTTKWLETGLGEKDAKDAEKKAEEFQAKKRDEQVTTYNRESEEKLKDITLLISHIKSMDVPKERKRHIHRTLSAYRTELENVVLFGELR